MTFTQAPETAGYAGEDYAFTTPVTTRYIQIYVTSSFPTGDGFTGISEIGFIPGGSYATWAAAKGIPGEPATGDFDNDGLTNLMEYALGKDPKVSSQPVGELSGKVITFTKGADAIANGDVSWVIQTSTTLAADSWTDVVTQAAGNAEPTISYTLPAGAGKVFARLVVTQTP